ncbi:MAG: 30S ribosomal protein S16 [Mycoplasma sp.]|nr:30S ribosomal protein S16 [Mycoplasma sp.]
MVKLRLKRMGKKHFPMYKIVAADAKAPRDGRIIEEVGLYFPIQKTVKIDKELVQKWLGYGAVPTPTVKNILKKEKISKK